MKSCFIKSFFLAACFLWLPLISIAQINPSNRQVVLQGFWWDYWNSNFPNGWSNYLAELAPRISELGVDAVWVPPSIKNSGTNSVGYSPFDHYDLGDKFQKNSLKTRMGDKDELLRMFAVLKANGIDVIQDIVLNHVTNAGSAAGLGGQDPDAMDDGSTNKHKNFRYVSFSTPAANETAANYLSRGGRFSKNWQNFYPNNSNVCCTNDINSPFWGPDISYEDNAFGLSSNATFNPNQSSQYMRNGMRNWLIWYKKQTGWDGVRIDAVKHFPTYATEDFLWNLQYNAVWASGTENMFAVGEYVGSMSELDNWANAVQNRAGTFDFSLRFALQDIITQGGAYNMGNIPANQQLNRQRTVPFVNNHDTYRPQLNTSGNITGWNTGSQIGSQIEVLDPRASVAYAIALSVDGAPEIFFEDLFNIGYLSNRFNHDPQNSSTLPTHSDIENIIWCHQNLHFKEGAYLVRWQAPDALVMERSGKALIAVTDNYSSWQYLTGVQTNFTDGTVLQDYSGANGTNNSIVYGNGKVDISIPPCDGSAPSARKGYSIWAPVGVVTNYSRPSLYITQEWEMDNDLGDNGLASLQEGGQIPSNSRDCRVVGRVFADSGSLLTVDVYPSITSNTLTLELIDKDCNLIDTLSSTGNFQFTKNISYSGWHTVRIRNTMTNQIGQKCWVKMNYLAPKTIQSNVVKNKCACSQSSGAELDELDYKNWEVFPNPVNNVLFVSNLSHSFPNVRFKLMDANGSILGILTEEGANQFELDLSPFSKGMYFLLIETNEGLERHKIIKN